MKKFLLASITLSVIPVVSSAQNWDTPVAIDNYAYASVFTGNLSMLLSIVIGIIATFLVLRAARKMGGGLFGTVLNYIGYGMSLVVVGTISVTLDPWISDIWLRLIHTTFFALGYILMVVGANKLLKGIMSN